MCAGLNQCIIKENFVDEEEWVLEDKKKYINKFI